MLIILKPLEMTYFELILDPLISIDIGYNASENIFNFTLQHLMADGVLFPPMSSRWESGWREKFVRAVFQKL